MIEALTRYWDEGVGIVRLKQAKSRVSMLGGVYASAQQTKDKFVQTWSDRLLGIKYAGIQGQPDKYAHALVSDVQAWGGVLEILNLHGPTALIQRTLCHKECPVCRALYTDARGGLLAIPISSLLQAPTHNLSTRMEWVLDEQGVLLEDIQVGVRTIGVAHWWDTPVWELSP